MTENNVVFSVPAPTNPNLPTTGYADYYYNQTQLQYQQQNWMNQQYLQNYFGAVSPYPYTGQAMNYYQQPPPPPPPPATKPYGHRNIPSKP